MRSPPSNEEKFSAYGQISLFDEESEEMMDSFVMKEVEDWSTQEKLEIEKSLLGFYVSGHPLDRYRSAIKTRVTVDTARMEHIPWANRPTSSRCSPSSNRMLQKRNDTTVRPAYRSEHLLRRGDLRR